MNKLLTTMTALAALGVAAPAAAQWQPGYQGQMNARGAVSIDNRIAQLETRLEAGIRAGTIDRREAMRLRGDIQQLRRLAGQYSRGGINQQQHADLQQRVAMLRRDIRTADRGSYDRYERPGEWAEYDGHWGQQAGLQDFSGRIAQLEARLDAGLRSGMIDRRSERTLRRQLDDLRRLDRQYSRGGLNWQQQNELQQRLAAVRQEIRTADRGSYDRYERRGEWAEYDNMYGRDPYGRDAYGRDPYGRGGPYEDPCAPTAGGGIGGVIGSIFGVGTSNCLQVGQRAHANLGAVPFEHRNRFRDGGGFYYRSDGRAIYAIDARTHVVVEVHPLYQ